MLVVAMFGVSCTDSINIAGYPQYLRCGAAVEHCAPVGSCSDGEAISTDHLLSVCLKWAAAASEKPSLWASPSLGPESSGWRRPPHCSSGPRCYPEGNTHTHTHKGCHHYTASDIHNSISVVITLVTLSLSSLSHVHVSVSSSITLRSCRLIGCYSSSPAVARNVILMSFWTIW